MTTSTLNSSRSFGIEIECFGITQVQAETAINAAGVSCHRENYGHSTPTTWKIVTDASVGDGFEVVSPILSGNAGLAQVELVADALTAAGAKIDRRCGFHVHVNARDLSGSDIVNCVRRYAANETIIDAFMPESRRNNQFCQPMASVARLVTSARADVSCEAIADMVGSRFYKMNVSAFLRHGTVEFRQHSGTVNGKKMINWIIFCVTFVEASKVTVVREETGTEDGSALRTNAIIKKFAILAAVLDLHNRRYNPVSAGALATAMDVAESTVPSYISQFRARYPGAEIQARRGRGYFNAGAPLSPLVGILAPTVSVSVQVPVEAGVFAGLPTEVASYFHERTQEFAAS